MIIRQKDILVMNHEFDYFIGWLVKGVYGWLVTCTTATPLSSLFKGKHLTVEGIFN
jgi:hypothetical protein